MIQLKFHWYHAMLGHPGSCHMRATLQTRYPHPRLRMHIERFACDKCQRAKPSGPSHGLIPNWDIVGAPWEEVAVDLISPLAASTPHATVEFYALTCIDTTTNLIEIEWIFKKSSDHVEPHLACLVPWTNASHPWQWGRDNRFYPSTAVMLMKHQTSSNHKQKSTG